MQARSSLQVSVAEISLLSVYKVHDIPLYTHANNVRYCLRLRNIKRQYENDNLLDS